MTANMFFTYSRHTKNNWGNVDRHEQIEINRWNNGAQLWALLGGNGVQPSGKVERTSKMAWPAIARRGCLNIGWDSNDMDNT